jgi:hypothetical protein
VFDALEKSLSTLKNSSVLVSDGNPGVEEELTVALDFSDGSRLEAVFWRIIKNGATGLRELTSYSGNPGSKCQWKMESI